MKFCIRNSPLFIGILLLFTHVLYGQNYYSNHFHYSTEQGLSHRAVHCVFEDQKGYIWAATSNGLNRFDGFEFKHWTTTDPDFNFNNISKIGQDDLGWLWLWNENQLFFFHPITEELWSVKDRFGDQFPINTSVEWQGSWKYYAQHTMPQDEKKRFYFISKDHTQIIRFHSTTGFEVLNIKLPPNPRYLLSQKNNGLLLVCNQQLIQYDANFQEINNFKIDKSSFAQLKTNVWTNDHLEKKSDTQIRNTLWENNLIFTDDDQKLSIQRFKFKNKKNESFWILGNEGWKIYDNDLRPLLFINQSEILPKETFNFINCYYADKKGNVWLGSDWGLSMIQLKQTHFSNYFTSLYEAQFPLNNSVRGIYSDSKWLYANLEMGGFVRIPLDQDTSLTNKKMEIIHQSLSNAMTWSTGNKVDYWGRPLSKINDHSFWIGNRRRLIQVDLLNNTNKSFYIPNEKKKDVDIWSIYTDKNLRVWLGTGNGLLIKEKHSDHLQRFENYGDYPELSKSVIQNMVSIDHQKIWLCTNNGLFLLDMKQQSIMDKWGAKESSTFVPPSKNIQHIYRDKDRMYWIATTNGLVKWDSLLNRIQVFNESDGFPNPVLYSVIEDDYNNLWISSDQGIIRFNKKSHTVRAFDENDGLHQSEFNRISFFKSKTGHLFFGGLNGITSFHPKDFNEEKSQHHSHLNLVQCSLLDRDGNESTDQFFLASQENKIKIKPKQNFLKLQVALMDFGSSEDKMYAYKIPRVQNNWINQNSPFLQLDRLPYGKYDLHIKGGIKGEGWSDKQLKIAIEVLRPFHLSFGFLIAALALLFFLFWFLFKARIYQLKSRQIKLEAKINEATLDLQKQNLLITNQKIELEDTNRIKDQIFAILGHDLRKPVLSFRGLVKKVDYLLRKEDYNNLKRFGETLQDDAHQLNKLIENLLNWSLLQKNNLIYLPNENRIAELINEILNNFKRPLRNKKIELNISIDPTLTIYADPNSLSTVFRNLIDNAIKFTPVKGMISILAHKTEVETQIIIKDSGVGMTSEKIKRIFELDEHIHTKGTDHEIGTGLGLHLVQELIRSNKGKISVFSEKGQGTQFTISIPNYHH